MWSIVPRWVFSAMYSKGSVAYCGFSIYYFLEPLLLFLCFVCGDIWRWIACSTLQRSWLSFVCYALEKEFAGLFELSSTLFVVGACFLMPSVLPGHGNAFCTFVESISMLSFLCTTQWLFAVESCSLALFLTLKGQQELAFY